MGSLRYLIHGGELFQTQEAVRSVEHYCSENGYTKHDVFEIGNTFVWSSLVAAVQELDMFADKQLLELRLSAPLTKACQKSLERVLDLQTEETVILVVAKKLTTDILKQNWVKTISQNGEVIEVKNIPAYQWPQWVLKRLQHLNIEVTKDASELLIKSYEGNLLDLNQALLNIKANHPDTLINFEICSEYVHEHNILSVFDLAQAIVAADNKRILVSIISLQNKQVEPILVLWSVTKELRLLLKLSLEFKRQPNVADDFLLKKFNLWPVNLTKYKKLLKTNTTAQLQKLITLAFKVDLVIKGVEPGNVIELICTLCFKLVNGNVNIVTSEG